MTIAFDDSRFPLIVVTFPRVTTDDEFRAYLARMDATARRGVRERAKVAVLLDATLAEPSPASARSRPSGSSETARCSPTTARASRS